LSIANPIALHPRHPMNDACGLLPTGIAEFIIGPRIRVARWLIQATLASPSPSPRLWGEGWGEGEFQGRGSAENPLTRIASDDALRPLSASFARRAPASGAR